MSMTLMLERVSGKFEDETPLADETSQPVAEGLEQLETGLLRIFDGQASPEETAEATNNMMEGTLTAIGMNGGDPLADDLEEEEPEATLSIEKAWHGLHYLLTGESWGGTGPRAFLLAGGLEQGEDYGYGPARYFTAIEVSAIAKELVRLGADDLWSKFDANAMATAGVYPEVWDEPEDELREEYCDYYEELQDFIATAAEQNEALRVYMT